MCYWSLHALEIMAPESLNHDIKQRCISTVLSCFSPSEGGFGGGFMQMAHLAPTYAAILVLCICEAWTELASLRPALSRFVSSMHNGDGSYRMHDGGETDIRALYCACVVDALLNLGIVSRELTIPWILSCQTYEGGFGAIPGREAHGGYTFCSLAALAILHGIPDLHEENVGSIRLTGFDHDRCALWVAQRQLADERGFNGRTNKLVDSCYSFWVGASAALVGPEVVDTESALQYVLCCCQAQHGGLRDKPRKSRDLYHTCYASSGLAVLGAKQLGVSAVDPRFNIRPESVQEARRRFVPQSTSSA
jgi:protein farnesyltransferase subunit beta